MDRQLLIMSLEESLMGINRCIEEVNANAERMGIDPYRVMTRDGELMLAPLLVARVNAVVALAGLRTQ